MVRGIMGALPPPNQRRVRTTGLVLLNPAPVEGSEEYPEVTCAMYLSEEEKVEVGAPLVAPPPALAVGLDSDGSVGCCLVGVLSPAWAVGDG